MSNLLSNYSIITVTPTLSTDAYAQGDVLFVATEIPNAVLGNGGCAELVAAFVLNQASGNTDDFDVYFHSGTTALGTINATANIADADIEALGINGVLQHDANVGAVAQLDTANLVQLGNLAKDKGTGNPILIQAAPGSTSVYFQAILTSSTTPTYAADDLDFIFHIKQK
tara:strand:+ start:1221 stop:1730 length:510 start_codon:yes stop_codon:yes gene_type:complete